MVAHLLYCETVAALHILAGGGHFVIKAFTFFEERSVHLLYLIAASFDQVYVTKPATSTQSNAEVFVTFRHSNLPWWNLEVYKCALVDADGVHRTVRHHPAYLAPRIAAFSRRLFW